MKDRSLFIMLTEEQYDTVYTIAEHSGRMLDDVIKEMIDDERDYALRLKE